MSAFGGKADTQGHALMSAFDPKRFITLLGDAPHGQSRRAPGGAYSIQAEKAVTFARTLKILINENGAGGT